MKKSSNQVLFLVGKTDADMYSHRSRNTKNYQLRELTIVAPRAYAGRLVGFRLQLGLATD